MARKKLTMRQIQEILRLKHQNQLSLREIASSCRLALSTVGDYLKRAEAASLGWPLPEGMSEEELKPIEAMYGDGGLYTYPMLITVGGMVLYLLLTKRFFRFAGRAEAY